MSTVSRRVLLTFALLALPVFGAVAGRFAAPSFARTHYIVQVAERVWMEESRGIAERTLESKAFRASGMSMDQLFREALEVRTRFVSHSTWFGLWCGGVVAATLIMWLRTHGRREFDADPSRCVECARCFMECPVEHKRRRDRSGR